MLYYKENQITNYHTVELIAKSNIKITERGKFDTPNTQIHDHSLSSLCTGTPKKWWVKLVTVSIKSGLPSFGLL